MADLLTYVGIMSIAVLGLYVAVLSGQLSVGHAAFFGIGGYVTAITTKQLGFHFASGLVAGALCSGMVALAFSPIGLRLKAFFFAIGTLGLGETLRIVIANTSSVGGVGGYGGIPLNTNIVTVYVILALLVTAFIRFGHSRTEQTLRAIGDDEQLAGSFGIDVKRWKVVAFAVSGAITGLAGGLSAAHYGYVFPDDLGIMPSFALVVFIALGGSRTFWGGLLGVAILGFAPEIFRFSAGARYILYGIVLVIVMIVRPDGLLTRRRLGSGAPALLLHLWRAVFKGRGTYEIGLGESTTK